VLDKLASSEAIVEKISSLASINIICIYLIHTFIQAYMFKHNDDIDRKDTYSTPFHFQIILHIWTFYRFTERVYAHAYVCLPGYAPVIGDACFSHNTFNPPVFIFTNLLKKILNYFILILKVSFTTRPYTSVYEVSPWLVSKLGDKAFRGERQTCNGVVEMFTASTRDATMDRVLVEFRDGKLHVVVASVAFGLGVSNWSV